MRDFTLEIYRQLLETLIKRNYTFITFEEYRLGQLSMDEKSNTESQIKNLLGDVIGMTDHSSLIASHSLLCLLRHDVDLLPENSLATAKIEDELGIKGIYYFRIVPESFDENILKQIVELGHEVGYHYETMDTCNGDIDKAYDEFCINLAKFRKIYPVKTICMHGSPRSKYDNKEIWKKYNYKELDVIGEPYFDIDFNVFGYLTDTGRRWNGFEVSIRDKVESKYKFKFKSTNDIINNIDQLPDNIMITVHPQRWTDDYALWTKELILQNVKNIIKKYLVKRTQ